MKGQVPLSMTHLQKPTDLTAFKLQSKSKHQKEMPFEGEKVGTNVQSHHHEVESIASKKTQSCNAKPQQDSTYLCGLQLGTREYCLHSSGYSV